MIIHIFLPADKPTLAAAFFYRSEDLSMCCTTMRRVAGAGLVVALAVAALLVGQSAVRSDDAKKPDKAAIERARETVKMVDDLNKGYVVHITETYVKAQEGTPAAKVAKKVFAHAEAKGWFSGRLIDATGEPANKANVAKSDFEKEAVKQMKAGKQYYDEVGTKDGKPVLRAATIVPVVMDQCIVCHPGHKKGELLGALIYEMPIK